MAYTCTKTKWIMKPFSNLKVLLKKIKLKIILIFYFCFRLTKSYRSFHCWPIINQIYKTGSLTQNSRLKKLKLKLNAAVTLTFWFDLSILFSNFKCNVSTQNDPAAYFKLASKVLKFLQIRQTDPSFPLISAWTN